MTIKIIIITLFIIILYCLGSALFYMLGSKNKRSSEAMLKSLTWRIILSFIVFLGLLAAFAAGWIKPHGLFS